MSKMCAQLDNRTQLTAVVRIGLVVSAAILLQLLASKDARAGLKICNGSLDLVNVAVGYETDDGIRTEGWWTVTANACTHLIQGDLNHSKYYLHIADGFGESRLAGDITLCIREEKFVLYDGDQCWQRGLIEADFYQVDTEGAQDWTVLLSYD